MCWYSLQILCTWGKLVFKLKIKLQEAKTIPFTKPKNVTRENLKAPKQPSAGKDFTASQHYFCSFPSSERFCTPFSSPYASPETPTTAIFWFAPIPVQRQGQQSRSLSFGASFGTQMNVPSSSFLHPCEVHSTCCPCPPCSGTFGISDSAFFPSHCPSSCHLLPHWKSRIWPAGKIHLDFSFPLPMARGNFVFLGHLSISLMN